MGSSAALYSHILKSTFDSPSDAQVFDPMKMEREREKAALINQLQSMKKMAREQGPRIVITPLKRFFNLSRNSRTPVLEISVY